jgi:tetratricopeptide (TPR) repeat protein
VVSFLFALLFSEKAAMLPGILLAYQLMFSRKQRKWGELIPFFVLSAVWGGLYLGQAGERLTELQTGFSGGGHKPNPMVQIPVAISSYLGLIFWPDKLALYHSEMFFSPLNYSIRVGLTGALLLLIGWAGWQGWQGKNWGKQTAFWLSWLIIALLPTLTPLGVSWIVAERYVYLGAVGIFALLAWGGWRLSQRKGWQEPMTVVFVLLTLALMIRTVVRNHDWKNQDNLWLAGARTSPSSSQNNNNLGDLYGRRGDLKRAEWHFKRAIELNPVYAEAHHNLANTYWQMGEIDKAIEYYQKALQLRPNLWQSHLQLANIYYQQGKKDEMRQELEAVLKIVPNHEGVRKALEEL